MLIKTIILLPSLLLLNFFLPAFAQKTAVKTIIIDAGHGGSDQGAAGLISTEAQVTLALTKKLGEKLAADLPQVNVLFTRTTDIIPGNGRNITEGLRYRANFANESKADLFISIHCNSAGRAPGGWNERHIAEYTEEQKVVGKGKKKRTITVKVPVYETVFVPNAVKGTETFIWTAGENSHKEQMVGGNVEFASSEDDHAVAVPEDDPAFNALKLIYTQKFFKKSLKLAEKVQEEFTKRGRVNRGVKQRNEKGIWVLHATGMPSILVEAGFISNKEEEEYMNSEAGQDEIVTDMVNAIKAYITSLETPKIISGSKPVNNESNSVAVVKSNPALQTAD
jgi:N-acetylmuramoyl-L-alanine amidase